MDLNQLLTSDIQNFICDNSAADLSKLAFKKNPFPTIDYKEILNQIECRQKSKIKLPTWYSAANCIYPSKVSIEQTSSEITANYKSKIVSGNAIIDLTGGFGVDAYYFSKIFKQVIHCEIDSKLSKIVAQNFENLNLKNINCIEGDGTAILKNLNQKFDCIYIDPSRRNDKKGKVFLLNDCIPNVPDLLIEYFQYSNIILIKTAPLLDLKAGLKELKFVKNIHIVAVENEVKELVWEINYNYTGAINIITRNFTKTSIEEFDFILNESLKSTFALPEKYLYEPNNCIMKSGGFNEVGTHFGLSKLHQHSHLYTSSEVKPFSGRVFQIVNVIPYSKKEMKIHFENRKINITIRNFPDSVESLRKKWNIKDGGTQYCFFTIDKNDTKIALICTKI